MSKIIKCEIEQNLDELGIREEFTFDLIPLVHPKDTLHLHEEGIPKIGSVIKKGMIIFGKFGRTVRFDPKKQITDWEFHTWSFEGLKAKSRNNVQRTLPCMQPRIRREWWLTPTSKQSRGGDTLRGVVEIQVKHVAGCHVVTLLVLSLAYVPSVKR